MRNLKTFIVLLFAVYSTKALALYEDSRISESLELDAILLVPSPSPEPYGIVADYEPGFCALCAYARKVDPTRFPIAWIRERVHSFLSAREVL